MNAPPVRPLLLWSGVLGGPLAFALDRLASLLLVVSGCRSAHQSTVIFGLTASQAMVGAITVLTALIALAAGIVSWRIWRLTVQEEEVELLVGSTSMIPFLALGGMFLSGLFFIPIIVTGASALVASTSCS